MADLQDVSVYLKNQAVAAVYPNGISQPSVADLDVRIFEGWPIRELLDADLGGFQLFNGQQIPRENGRAAQVSIFPYGTSAPVVGQILDNTYVIVPPVHGMVVSIGSDQATVNVMGSPAGPNEFITIIVANLFVASVAASNLTVAQMLTALAGQLSANVAGITTTSSTIVIPNQPYITARIGSIGTLGKVTHKQIQVFAITTWAPDHNSRFLIASSIDNLIKQNIRISMPDTSQARVCYQRTLQSDSSEPKAEYRRDLYYQVEYATLQEFQGFEITSMATTISELSNVPIPCATFPNIPKIVPQSSIITNAPLPDSPFASTTEVF